MLTQVDTAAVRQPARTRRGADAGVVRSAADVARDERIGAALQERLTELRAEYDGIRVEAVALNQDGLAPVAGDDVADIGTMTFAREQEVALANAILERVLQVERALHRLAEGGYGRCEACAEAIPPARLAAFPSVTLCVSCKQRSER